jgi:aerobic carbon-monoxide dehydrogenase medium subunit
MPTGWAAPRTVDEAIAILLQDPDARCLAGGQTLVAMMNAGLAEPSTLVTLRHVGELAGIQVDADGAILIGAMTRHAEVAREARLAGGLAVVREAASGIAHPAIRNLGTLGGSLCHADPNSDYPAAVTAAEAEIEVAGAQGRRWVSAGDFFVDFLTSALEPGELVTRVRLPKAPRGSVGVYEKFARVDGDYATVSVALMLSLSGEVCESVSLALGSCGATPVRSPEAEARLRGSRLDADALQAACGHLLERCSPIDDVRGSAEYRRMLVPRLVGRAFARAKQKAGAAA